MTVRSLKVSPEISPHCNTFAQLTEVKDWRGVFERHWKSQKTTNILTVTAGSERWQVNLELLKGALSPQMVGIFIVAKGTVEIPTNTWSVVRPQDLLWEIARGYGVNLKSVDRVKTDTVEVDYVAGMAILKSTEEDETFALKVGVPNDVVRGILNELEGIGTESES